MSPDPTIDDAQLAAYLAGDIDEVTARRIDAQLGQDPDLGRRLDRIHDVMVELTRPDEVAVPEGIRDRVRAQVAEASGPAAPVTRARRPSRWTNWGAGVAAALVAVAIVGGTVVQSIGGGSDSDETAGDDSITMRAEQDEAGDGAASDNDVALDDQGSDEAADAPDSGGGDDAAMSDMAESDEAESGADSGDEAVEEAAPAPIPLEEAEAVNEASWTDARDVDPDVAACRSAVEERVEEPAALVTVVREDADRVVFEMATLAEAGDDVLAGRTHVTVSVPTCEILAVE